MPNVLTKIDTSKKPVDSDWHKADIICGLWKLGTSVQKLSRENKYKGNGLEQAIRRPWPKGERIIAEALGLTPQQVWPSRYHTDGSPRSGRGERGIGDARRGKRSAKHNASALGVNVHSVRSV